MQLMLICSLLEGIYNIFKKKENLKKRILRNKENINIEV